MSIDAVGGPERVTGAEKELALKAVESALSEYQGAYAAKFQHDKVMPLELWGERRKEWNEQNRVLKTKFNDTAFKLREADNSAKSNGVDDPIGEIYENSESKLRDAKFIRKAMRKARKPAIVPSADVQVEPAPPQSENLPDVDINLVEPRPAEAIPSDATPPKSVEGGVLDVTVDDEPPAAEAQPEADESLAQAAPISGSPPKAVPASEPAPEPEEHKAHPLDRLLDYEESPAAGVPAEEPAVPAPELALAPEVPSAPAATEPPAVELAPVSEEGGIETPPTASEPAAPAARPATTELPAVIETEKNGKKEVDLAVERLKSSLESLSPEAHSFVKTVIDIQQQEKGTWWKESSLARALGGGLKLGQGLGEFSLSSASFMTGPIGAFLSPAAFAHGSMRTVEGALQIIEAIAEAPASFRIGESTKIIDELTIELSKAVNEFDGSSAGFEKIKEKSEAIKDKEAYRLDLLAKKYNLRANFNRAGIVGGLAGAAGQALLKGLPTGIQNMGGILVNLSKDSSLAIPGPHKTAFDLFKGWMFKYNPTDATALAEHGIKEGAEKGITYATKTIGDYNVSGHSVLGHSIGGVAKASLGMKVGLFGGLALAGAAVIWQTAHDKKESDRYKALAKEMKEKSELLSPAAETTAASAEEPVTAAAEGTPVAAPVEETPAPPVTPFVAAPVEGSPLAESSGAEINEKEQLDEIKRAFQKGQVWVISNPENKNLPVNEVGKDQVDSGETKSSFLATGSRVLIDSIDQEKKSVKISFRSGGERKIYQLDIVDFLRSAEPQTQIDGVDTRVRSRVNEIKMKWVDELAKEKSSTSKDSAGEKLATEVPAVAETPVEENPAEPVAEPETGDEAEWVDVAEVPIYRNNKPTITAKPGMTLVDAKGNRFKIASIKSDEISPEGEAKGQIAFIKSDGEGMFLDDKFDADNIEIAEE